VTCGAGVTAAFRLDEPLAVRLETPAAAGGLVWALLFLSGCATPQLAALAQRWPEHLPEAAQLSHVPFFPQDDHLCGPASLAMVAQAAGVAVTPAELTDQVYLPGRQGALQAEMLAAARRLRQVAYPLAPRLPDLLREVASGQPVLVLQNLSLPIKPLWHYAVVIGYDRARDEIVLHSGVTPRLTMTLSTFEHTWARSGYWAMRVTAPTQLPATAEPDAWATAVAALERIDPAAAETAYATALRQWPDHRPSLLGAGNAAYAQGQLGRAAQAFEVATRVQPGFADAWNNLAQVRHEQGQLKAARTAIARAVALGGPRLGQYQALQQKIRAR
jgi:Peptidase_C39 like family/Tetratricopeptide repeat